MPARTEPSPFKFHCHPDLSGNFIGWEPRLTEMARHRRRGGAGVLTAATARSADFQSAVSPNGIRQVCLAPERIGDLRGSQITNLRYSPAPAGEICAPSQAAKQPLRSIKYETIF